MISVHHLTKRIDGRAVVDDVTFSVSRGECLRIAGPPHSGRTTLLRILSTLARPTTGDVWIDGVDATRQPVEARRRLVCVSPDVIRGSRLSVGEYLWMINRARGTGRAAAFNENLTGAGIGVETSFDRLPDGRRVAVALTAALVHRPPVVLVDARGLDMTPRERGTVEGALREMKEHNAAIVMCADAGDELAALAGRVVTLRGGRVEG
jgi:ABC-type multidrug transport system ATPase subunit